MRNLIIILLFISCSCKNQVHTDILIYPEIFAEDSLLVLTVKNNTETNVAIEFPALNNFYYKDELEKSNSEVLYLRESFTMKNDSVDDAIMKNIDCICISNLLEEDKNCNLKFLSRKQTKKYYYKIHRYRKNKTIVFADDNYSFVANLMKNDHKLSNIKNQSCKGYAYFTGSFRFSTEEITLK